MQHRMGRRPLIFIHMTNTNIVPMLSFGTLLLDHEWRDQGDFREKDFHERLDLDDDASLLLAQSTGFQSGCIGVVHNLLHGEAQIRSALALPVHSQHYLVLQRSLLYVGVTSGKRSVVLAGRPKGCCHRRKESGRSQAVLGVASKASE